MLRTGCLHRPKRLGGPSQATCRLHRAQSEQAAMQPLLLPNYREINQSNVSQEDDNIARSRIHRIDRHQHVVVSKRCKFATFTENSCEFRCICCSLENGAFSGREIKIWGHTRRRRRWTVGDPQLSKCFFDFLGTRCHFVQFGGAAFWKLCANDSSMSA